MKIVRFRANGRLRYGILVGKTIRVIGGRPFNADRVTDEEFAINEVKLVAPCEPSKIVAVGVNYKSHALEMNSQLPKNPLIFIKPSTSVIGPEDDIVYPPSSRQVDYEGELGVVIKRKAWRVPEDKAQEYVLGYTCFNDVTARDLQRTDGQWTRSKGFDTFAPIGPWIETDANAASLVIETAVNGKVVQRGNTSDLVFAVPALVSFISNVMTLLPGDVIATGTPGGIGPMQPGDVVEVRIDHIGTLRNRLVRL